MEEKTVKSIPAMPFAVMLGAIQAVIGFIAGIIVAIVSTAIMSIISSWAQTAGVPDWGATGFGVLFGVGAIITMPIVGFIGGLIQGLIIAVIYNLLAPRIGGIKLRFEE